MAHSEYWTTIQGMGLQSLVAEELDGLALLGVIDPAEFDERAIEGLKAFPEDDGVEVLKYFKECATECISGVSAYLCGLFKLYKGAKARGESPKPIKGADPESLREILERTGYSVEVTLGQRKYGGPPPNWGSKVHPGSGHELYIGKIPKGMFEDDLVPLFEKYGVLWDFRVMMDPAIGDNKGYGFATYVHKEGAKAAAAGMEGYEIKPGKFLKVNVSQSNNRLYVGNIPKTKGKEEIMEAFGQVVEGITDVIVYNVADNPKLKNRGFCFIDFESHKEASNAKRKLAVPKFSKMWQNDIYCDWADPQEEPDAEIMKKVKVVYVRNLTNEVTEDMIEEAFSAFGKIEKVKKQKDYAFVHFYKRENALAAIEQMNGQEMGGNPMNVQLAKPMSEEARQKRQQRKFEAAVGGYGQGGGGGGGAYGYGDEYEGSGSYGAPMAAFAPGMGRGGMGRGRGMPGRGRGGMPVRGALGAMGAARGGPAGLRGMMAMAAARARGGGRGGSAAMRGALAMRQMALMREMVRMKQQMAQLSQYEEEDDYGYGGGAAGGGYGGGGAEEEAYDDGYGDGGYGAGAGSGYDDYSSGYGNDGGASSANSFSAMRMAGSAAAASGMRGAGGRAAAMAASRGTPRGASRGVGTSRGASAAGRGTPGGRLVPSTRGALTSAAAARGAAVAGYGGGYSGLKRPGSAMTGMTGFSGPSAAKKISVEAEEDTSAYYDSSYGQNW